MVADEPIAALSFSDLDPPDFLRSRLWQTPGLHQASAHEEKI
jgi:hypothetical protein